MNTSSSRRRFLTSLLGLPLLAPALMARRSESGKALDQHPPQRFRYADGTYCYMIYVPLPSVKDRDCTGHRVSFQRGQCFEAYYVRGHRFLCLTDQPDRTDLTYDVSAVYGDFSDPHVRYEDLYTYRPFSS